MLSLNSRDWIACQLRSDLEAAKERLANADSSGRPEAREHFRTALRRFTDFVLRDQIPTGMELPGLVIATTPKPKTFVGTGLK